MGEFGIGQPVPREEDPYLVRVVSENVGGGFGMKGALYNEYILCVVAAKLTGQPVKWISERSEGLLTDEQARDNLTEA